jgi:DNA repair protein RecO (recombination protein O)
VPLKSSESFVLDARKFKEADLLVSLFTADEGKIRGVAPSGAKSRRRFGGKLERLSRVRVAWFEKEGIELVRIESCDLLEESFTLQRDLRTAATLAYVAEVTDTFAREREPDPRYFRLLKALMGAFRQLGPGGDPGPLARYFETWTLRLHGLMPDLDRCGHCGKESGGGGAFVEAGETPVAVCASCRRKAPAAAAGPGRSPGMGMARFVKISPAALAALDRFRTTAPGDLAGTVLAPAAAAEIETFAVALLTAFVGHPFRSYAFMKEWSQEPV